MVEPLRLLVVCLGNICRSPMAEGALRRHLRELDLETMVVVDSVGLGPWHVDRPPDPRAIATAAQHGVDISRLRGRQLGVEDYARFDWMLCADRPVLTQVRAGAPEDPHAGSALLMDWAGLGDISIPDPYTGSLAGFERAWRMIDAATHAIAVRCRAVADGRADD